MTTLVRDAQSLAPYAQGILVPTMGAFHDGHRALVRLAADAAARTPGNPHVIVSVFVNPAQFNEQIDFDSYPRDLDADIRDAKDSGATCVFAPSVNTVYPSGVWGALDTPIIIPPIATDPGLEDRTRPGHFEGVCRVLRRLFDLTQPRAAIFGEKDWQQLQLARAIAQEPERTLDIIPCPTVREPDGLAMSSRNTLLDHQGRTAARCLRQALLTAQKEHTPEDAERAMKQTIRSAGAPIEYAAVRDAQTLMPIATGKQPGPAGMRALVAARFADVRLLDNDAWPAPSA